jgi:hypothetical protein
MMTRQVTRMLLLLLNWVRATPDRPFVSYRNSSQTRLIGQMQSGTGSAECRVVLKVSAVQVTAPVVTETARRNS